MNSLCSFVCRLISMECLIIFCKKIKRIHMKTHFIKGYLLCYKY